jgi:hypothetical protein
MTSQTKKSFGVLFKMDKLDETRIDKARHMFLYSMGGMLLKGCNLMERDVTAKNQQDTYYCIAAEGEDLDVDRSDERFALMIPGTPEVHSFLTVGPDFIKLFDWEQTARIDHLGRVITQHWSKRFHDCCLTSNIGYDVDVLPGNLTEAQEKELTEMQGRIIFTLPCVEVKVEEDDNTTFHVMNESELETEIMAGHIQGNAKARILSESNSKTGLRFIPWQQVKDLKIKSIQRLYFPTLQSALSFVWVGLMAGIVLKLLHTTVLMFDINEKLGAMLLATIGAFVISSFVKQAAFAVPLVIFASIKFFGTGLGFITMIFTSALVGAILGAATFFAIGGLWGVMKRPFAKKAPDAHRYLLGDLSWGVVTPISLAAFVIWGFIAIQGPLEAYLNG